MFGLVEAIKADGKSRLMFEFVPNGHEVLLPTAPDAIMLERWCHVVATYDGLRIWLYINGKEKVGKQFNQTELSMIPLTVSVLGDFGIMMKTFVGVG